MLSLTHNFLFVHVPKTAGNAIQGALSAYSADTIVALAPYQDGVERFEVRSTKYDTIKHSTLADYSREYGEDLFGRLFKFSCVRNPWDRCVSHFFSPHRGNVTWDRQAFLDFVVAEVRPLRYFIATDPGDGRTLAECLAGVNAIIRFESLQADFESVCASLGVPSVILPRHNASEKGDYRRYYDAASAARVRQLFEEEIAHFGYALP